MAKKILLVMVLMWVPVYSQIQTMEKQAVHMAQHILVSKLDSGLPSSAFGPWFNQLIGPEAGVVWQLTECGERSAQPNEKGRDLIACAEANALLPDGRQVIVAISVGTFRRGISGEPAFFSGVVEQNNNLYHIRRLRDLPGLLRDPKKLPVPLPSITSGLPKPRFYSKPVYVSSLNMSPYPWTDGAPTPADERPTMGLRKVQDQPASQRPRKVQEGILRGSAVTIVKPVYPPVAKSMNIIGDVQVEVLISEDGKVVNAKAISGNPVLRASAVDAARKWVFQPTLVNGKPVKAEGILTFVFNTGSK